MEPHRRTVRWWPALAILLVAGVALAWIWLRDVDSVQNERVVPTFPVLFVTALALVGWSVVFSRFATRTRVAILLVTLAVVGAGLLLLEIKAVDGNLVPIVGWRFAGEREFDAPSVSAPAELAAGPGDYPQLYGPGRSASLDGPALARDWQADPPRELWRREVGESCSSFAVVGNAAVTQEQRGDRDSIVRYDLRTGEQVWVHSETAPFETTIGGRGARATPTIAGDRVFALGATGNLYCVELATGRRVWSRNVLGDHDGGLPDWGMASSPLVVGDLVMVQLGNRSQGLAAYDRRSGEPAWRAGEHRGSYSSPKLMTVAGVPTVVVAYHDAVAGHDPATGRVLWTLDWPNPGSARVSMPIVLDDDRVFVSMGYGVGSRMFRVWRDGDGFASELLWESPRLKSKFAPIVAYGGAIFGLDDGVLVALDPATGDRLWKRGRYGHGQFLRVGDLLLLQTEDGPVVLLEANPAELRELAWLEALSDRTWNPPALAGDILLVRNHLEAAAYELPLAPEQASDRR